MGIDYVVALECEPEEAIGVEEIVALAAANKLELLVDG